MSSPALLPPEFADLEPFAAIWVLPGGHERMQRRLNSTMEELQAFYDSAFPRAEAAMSYLDSFALDDLPDTALNLMRLLYALSSVTLAVEMFKQPRDPNCGATYLDWVSEPAL